MLGSFEVLPLPKDNPQKLLDHICSELNGGLQKDMSPQNLWM